MLWAGCYTQTHYCQWFSQSVSQPSLSGDLPVSCRLPVTVGSVNAMTAYIYWITQLLQVIPPVHAHVCYIQNNVFDFWSWIIWFGVKPSIETPCAFINYGHDMQCEFSELTFFSLNALIHANTWTTDHVSCKWGFTRGKQMCIIKVGTDASANRTTSGLIYIM